MTYIVIQKTTYGNISPSVRIVDDEAYDLETANAVKKVSELKNTNDNTTFHLVKIDIDKPKVIDNQLELPFEKRSA